MKDNKIDPYDKARDSCNMFSKYLGDIKNLDSVPIEALVKAFAIIWSKENRD